MDRSASTPAATIAYPACAYAGAIHSMSFSTNATIHQAKHEGAPSRTPLRCVPIELRNHVDSVVAVLLVDWLDGDVATCRAVLPRAAGDGDLEGLVATGRCELNRELAVADLGRGDARS